MSFRSLLPAFLLLLILGNAPVFANEPAQPFHLSFYYGNGLFGYSTLTLKDDGQLVYEEHSPPAGADTSTIITTSTSQWAMFREALDAINVWSWEKNYPNDAIADGTQWNIEISYHDKTIVSSGSNAFPAASGGSNDSPEPSEPFKQLLEAFHQLSGKEFR